MITVCVGEVDIADRCDADQLPAAERRRWARVHRPDDRRRFLATWAVASSLIGTALGIDPRDVVLDRRCRRCGVADHAKPRVVGADLELSVSHSGGVLAVALSPGGAVGVDVEQDIPERWSASMAELVLADGEPVPDTASQATVWARKEAVLKCVGDGLMSPPAGLRLTGVGPVPRILAWDEHPDLVAAVQVVDLPVRAGYRAALAVRGPLIDAIDIVNPPKAFTRPPAVAPAPAPTEERLPVPVT